MLFVAHSIPTGMASTSGPEGSARRDSGPGGAYVADGRFPDGFVLERAHAQHAAVDVVADWLGIDGPRVAPSRNRERPAPGKPKPKTPGGKQGSLF